MNKYKKLAGNTMILSIGSFGSKILSFLLVGLYTKYIGVNDYSVSEIFLQTINILVPLATLSIEEAVMRFGLDRNHDKKQIYSSGITVFLCSYTFMIILSPIIYHLPDLKDHILLFYLCLLASGFRMINQQFLRARNALKLYAFDGILATLNLFICNMIFIVNLGWGVRGYIISLLISDVMSSVIIMSLSQAKKFINFKLVNIDIIKSMLRYSVPLIPTYILWWIVSASDRYMVKFMVSEYANGIYSFSYKIPTLISVVSTIFFQAWQLSAIKDYESEEDTKSFYTVVFKAYQSMLFVASAGILFLLIPLTAVLDSSANNDFLNGGAFKYSAFLVIGVLMSCFCQFLSSVYSATAHTKNSLWTSLIAAVVNIILNLILIPTLGVIGAAIATMLSYGACCIVRIIDSRKYIAFKIDIFKIVFNIIALFAMCGIILLDMKFSLIWLFLCLIAIMLENSQEILMTVKRIIK